MARTKKSGVRRKQERHTETAGSGGQSSLSADSGAESMQQQEEVDAGDEPHVEQEEKEDTTAADAAAAPAAPATPADVVFAELHAGCCAGRAAPAAAPAEGRAVPATALARSRATDQKLTYLQKKEVQQQHQQRRLEKQLQQEQQAEQERFLQMTLQKMQQQQTQLQPEAGEALWKSRRRPPVAPQPKSEGARVESVKPRPRRGRAEGCTEERFPRRPAARNVVYRRIFEGGAGTVGGSVEIEEEATGGAPVEVGRDEGGVGQAQAEDGAGGGQHGGEASAEARSQERGLPEGF